MKTIKLAVLFGGVSTEHDVSCKSVTTILKHLDAQKYSTMLIGITKQGRMLHYTGDISDIANGQWQTHDVVDCTISTNRTQKGVFVEGALHPIDCVFPVLHGKNGEDGTIQGMLQLVDIPFVGCDAISSANCMDKEMTHIILQNAGVPMAPWTVVRKAEPLDQAVARIEQSFDYPLFTKPANAGSSFGVSKVRDGQELQAGLTLALQHDHKVIVEQNIVGKEVECAVLGNADATASTVGEVEAAHEFYDFDAKYVNPDSKTHIPARIADADIQIIRQRAVQAYHAMGCAGLARVDFFVVDDGRILLNELNTLPGFTNISMYPKLWSFSGVPIATLLDRLIAYGMERAYE